jgi:membrane protein
MPFQKYAEILRTAISNFVEDAAFRLSAALSFYTILSLSPLLLVLVAVSGLVGVREAMSDEMVDQIRTIIGEAGAEVAEAVLKSAENKEQGLAAMIVGMATLLFGATGAFAQFQEALNTIWEVEAKPGRSIWSFARTRLVSMTMVLLSGLLLLSSMVLSAAVAVVRSLLADRLPEMAWFWQRWDFLVSVGLMTVLFALMFKMLPDVKIAWRDVVVGALLTGVMMTAGKFAIGWYLSYGSVGSAYGAAGSLIALLVWIYYSALIVFLGAEITQVYAHRRGAPFVPKRHAQRTHSRK